MANNSFVILKTRQITVGELIRRLQTQPDDAKVFLRLDTSECWYESDLPEAELRIRYADTDPYKPDCT